MERNWTIELEGITHRIGLTSSIYYPQGTEIRRDDRILFHGRYDGGNDWHYPFLIEGHVLEIGIAARGIGFEAFLTVDGALIEPSDIDEKRKKPGRLAQKSLAQTAYWRELAKATGLKYASVRGLKGRWRHRLLGNLGDLWVAVRHERWWDLAIEIFGVFPKDSEAMRDELRKALKEGEKESGDSSTTSGLRIHEDRFEIRIPYRPWAEEPASVARRLLAMIDRAAQAAQPLPEDYCEGANCTGKTTGASRMVLEKGEPRILCPSCAKEALVTPGREPRISPEGLMVGFLIALMGGLVWAFGGFYRNSVLTLIWAGFIMALSSGLMRMTGAGSRRQSVKTSVWLMLAGFAGGLLLMMMHSGFQGWGLAELLRFHRPGRDTVIRNILLLTAVYVFAWIMYTDVFLSLGKEIAGMEEPGLLVFDTEGNIEDLELYEIDPR